MEQSKTTNFTVGQVWDDRHSPIFTLFPVKAATAVKAGQVLKVGEDSLTVEPAAAEDSAYVGVACEEVEAGNKKYVNVLIHGTVKTEKITVGSDALTAEGAAKLRAAGVYAID